MNAMHKPSTSFLAVVVLASILQKIFDFELSQFIENNYFIENNFDFEEFRVFFLTHVYLVAVVLYCVVLSLMYTFTTQKFEFHIVGSMYWLFVAAIFNLR